ncbi:hypothetical protein [Pedobacter africanus]|uniref:hypothetical protein n=1 Tax=Pedobacter africanus TaxID=151894 RepID=UPI0013563F26|nr:hypothetical protein [Pedobacter africanus]
MANQIAHFEYFLFGEHKNDKIILFFLNAALAKMKNLRTFAFHFEASLLKWKIA